MNLGSLASSAAACDRLLEGLRDAAYAAQPADTPLGHASNRVASEAEVRIADLSDSLSIRPYDFARKFVREFGLSPRAYRRQARLQRAMSLLAEDGGSLAQIAAASGHCDQSHLARNLMRETGLTPLEFRAATGVR